MREDVPGLQDDGSNAARIWPGCHDEDGSAIQAIRASVYCAESQKMDPEAVPQGLIRETEDGPVRIP